NKYRRDWAQGLPAWLANTIIPYQRGFPISVSATLKQFLADGEKVRRQLPLREVHLARVTGHGTELAASPLLAGLPTLNLRNNKLLPDDLRALAGSPHLKGLRAFYLSRETGVEEIQALAAAPWLSQLEGLDLMSCRLGIEGARLLGGIHWERL